MSGNGTVTYSGTGASPCYVDVCNDPDSEECMLFTMEYCANTPEDKACAMFVPTFTRAVLEESELQVTEAAFRAQRRALECSIAYYSYCFGAREFFEQFFVSKHLEYP